MIETVSFVWRSFISNVRNLPLLVKHVCVNVFLFVLGWWLGADMLFSIYVQSIVDAVWAIGLLAWIVAALKLLLSIPVGFLNDKINPKYLLIFSKIIYIAVGVLYVLAGVQESVHLLMLGIVFNGIASPILFTTNQSIIRSNTSAGESAHAFALFHTAMQGAYIVGAIAVSFFIEHIQVYQVYIAIVVMSVIALLRNITIPIDKEQGLWQTVNTYLFHQNIYKKVWNDLKEYNITLYITLFLQMMYGVLDYIGRLFVPLLAVSQNLSLSEVAIIFAIMRVPHIFSLFFTALFAKAKAFLVVSCSYLAMSFALWGLAFIDSFIWILVLVLTISLCLAIVRPLILGFISQLIQARHRAEITGVQEMVTRLGEVIGSVGFGLIAFYSTVQFGFLVLGILLLIISLGIFMQQRYFQLPQWWLGTVISHTVLNVIETLGHSIRRKTHM